MGWEKTRRKTALWLAIGAAALLVARSGRADELKLKDGTKITGTIVGFEENSFKVKTSYGFAEVQKSQVVSITITDPAKKAEAKEKAAAEGDTTTAKPAAKDRADASSSETAEANSKTKDSANAPSSKAAKSDDSPLKSVDTSAPAVALKEPAPSKPPTTSPAPAAATADKPAGPPPNTLTTAIAQGPPPKPAAPEPIREEVTGNTYTNDTYGFHMYKPPDWQVIAGARAMLPGAITAMGTDDERTYLLIGQEPAGKSLATDIDAAQKRLRDIMDNFRPLGETHITVSGAPAVEDRFRGTVDQHDWSGVAVFVQHGAQLYTIFGMTLADNDLVQIQENVIRRAISSMQFTRQ
jgi:hypothetical protein